MKPAQELGDSFGITSCSLRPGDLRVVTKKIFPHLWEKGIPIGSACFLEGDVILVVSVDSPRPATKYVSPDQSRTEVIILTSRGLMFVPHSHLEHTTDAL